MSDFEIKGPGRYVTRNGEIVRVVWRRIHCKDDWPWLGEVEHSGFIRMWPDDGRVSGEEPHPYDITSVYVPDTIYDPRDTSEESNTLKSQMELCMKYGREVERKTDNDVWRQKLGRQWWRGTIYRIAQPAPPTPPPKPTKDELVANAMSAFDALVAAFKECK